MYPARNKWIVWFIRKTNKPHNFFSCRNRKTALPNGKRNGMIKIVLKIKCRKGEERGIRYGNEIHSEGT